MLPFNAKYTRITLMPIKLPPCCLNTTQSSISEDATENILTPDRWQSKTLLTIDERGSKAARNSAFDCHLSPVVNSVSNDILSMFVDSINVFVCRLSGVIRLLSFRARVLQIHFQLKRPVCLINEYSCVEVNMAMPKEKLLFFFFSFFFFACVLQGY